MLKNKFMYLDYFEKAFYINLDNRIDRKVLFENRIFKLGLSIPRYSAILLDKNYIESDENFKKDSRRHFKLACTLSHFEIIRMAKENGWKNVLIFEDDCIFCDDFLNKIGNCIEELKQYPWDLFYMGGEPNQIVLPLSNYLRVCPVHGGMYGTHSYAINNTFYDKILKIDPKRYAAIDSMYLHQLDRTYVLTKELLVFQDDESESDLWGGRVKRKAQYELAYKQFVK
jgi:glycosyl transferase family 25